MNYLKALYLKLLISPSFLLLMALKFITFYSDIISGYWCHYLKHPEMTLGLTYEFMMALGDGLWKMHTVHLFKM